MIKPGDLVCVTRKCCDDGTEEHMGITYIVTRIRDGYCIRCGMPAMAAEGYRVGNALGAMLHRLTKIDPLKEPETVEEEAHA